MITITNNKIDNLSPVWASFKGFSLLFDNPDLCFRLHNNMEFIDCSLAPLGTLQLYERLRDALEIIGGPLLTTSLLFFPLPFASYHVTMLDGVNIDNISNTKAIYRQELQACITDIEATIVNMPQCTTFLEVALYTQRFEEIAFQFSGLEIWGHQVLVALLTPAADSDLTFHTLSATRGELADKLLTELNVPSFSTYTPHISLGYFANREAALRARAHLAEWVARFTNTVKDAQVSFHSVSLYGFTDMTRFFRSRKHPITPEHALGQL